MSIAGSDVMSGALMAAQRGDVKAFEHIVATHYADMRRVCVVVARDVALAEEAVQAVWPEAWRRLSKVKDPAQLRSWLMSMALTGTAKLMAEPRRPATADGSGARDGFGGYQPGTAIGQLDVREHLEAMEASDRALLALRYVAGFDESEVAAAAAIKEEAAHDRLEALMVRLRAEAGLG